VQYLQTVPSRPQAIGRRTDSSTLPLTAALHDKNTIESLRQELLGKINAQANDIWTLHSSNAKLQSSNSELISKVNGLTFSNAELKASNAELKASNAELISSNAELISSNAELSDKVHKLASSNAEMSITLQQVSRLFCLDSAALLMCLFFRQHTTRFHALNRRIVLDDARNKLANEYNFTLDELRPRRLDVGLLVQLIQSRLNREHSNLLSCDALTMMFDSSDDSMRDSGNKAAHGASLADRADSVLQATLTNSQRSLLGQIYYFAHGKEPDFETGA
jgi:hypothetical protein